jgi:hypothetical protein
VAWRVASSSAVITSARRSSWAPIDYQADERRRRAVLARTPRYSATLGRDLLRRCRAAVGLAEAFGRTGDIFTPVKLLPAVSTFALGCIPYVTYVANVDLVAAGRIQT